MGSLTANTAGSGGGGSSPGLGTSGINPAQAGNLDLTSTGTTGNATITLESDLLEVGFYVNGATTLVLATPVTIQIQRSLNGGASFTTLHTVTIPAGSYPTGTTVYTRNAAILLALAQSTRLRLNVTVADATANTTMLIYYAVRPTSRMGAAAIGTSIDLG